MSDININETSIENQADQDNLDNCIEKLENNLENNNQKKTEKENIIVKKDNSIIVESESNNNEAKSINSEIENDLSKRSSNSENPKSNHDGEALSNFKYTDEESEKSKKLENKQFLQFPLQALNNLKDNENRNQISKFTKLNDNFYKVLL